MDKIYCAVSSNRQYSGLWDEIYTWLCRDGNGSCEKTPEGIMYGKGCFSGVYMINELGVDYSRNGFDGIKVTVRKGRDLLSYAEHVAKLFNIETVKKTYVKDEEIILFLKENAKAVNRPMMECEKKYREDWIELHKRDRTELCLEDTKNSDEGDVQSYSVALNSVRYGWGDSR